MRVDHPGEAGPVALGRLLLLGDTVDVYAPWYWPWIAVSVLLIAVVGFESVVANVALLNRRPMTRAIGLLAITHSLILAATAYWLLNSASGLRPGTLGWSLAALLVILVTVILLAVTAGMVGRAIAGPTLTPYPTWFNLFQDTVLFTGLVVVFSFIPLFVVRHLEKATWHWLLDAWLTVGPVLGFTSVIVMYTLANNRRHVAEKEAKAAASAPSELAATMPVDRLAAHVRFQNRAALVMTVPTAFGAWEAAKDWKLFKSVVWYREGWWRSGK